MAAHNALALDTDRIRELYEGGSSAQAIADEMGASKTAILTRLRAMRVELRPVGFERKPDHELKRKREPPRDRSKREPKLDGPRPSKVRPTGLPCAVCKRRPAIGDEFCSTGCAKSFYGVKQGLGERQAA